MFVVTNHRYDLLQVLNKSFYGAPLIPMIFCIVMPQVEAGAENKRYMYEACQLIQSELGLYFSSGTTLDIDVFSLAHFLLIN